MRFRDIKVGQEVFLPGMRLPRRRRWLRGRVRQILRDDVYGPLVAVQESGEPVALAGWYYPPELRPIEEGYPKGGKGR